MSGPKPPNLCPDCRHLSSNGKVCYASDMHPFKKGVCRAFEAKAEAKAEAEAEAPADWSPDGSEEIQT